jgi:type IV pilus assembly protein PilX
MNCRAQSGIVLVSALLLLVVVTLMALSIFRSLGIQEKISGNVREKNRALQAAVSAQQYAEYWLANTSNAVFAVAHGNGQSAAVTCPNSLLDANLGQGQICLNSLATNGLTASAWPTSGTGYGVLYTPPGMNISGGAIVNAAVRDQYFARPQFYIADVGASIVCCGEIYQVDASSYGLTQAALAEVESTVAITCVVGNLGGLGPSC